MVKPGPNGPVMREVTTEPMTATPSAAPSWRLVDATAAALGVHRHTARARIAQIERVMGGDLSFPVRAELWAALQVAPL